MTKTTPKSHKKAPEGQKKSGQSGFFRHITDQPYMVCAASENEINEETAPLQGQEAVQSAVHDCFKKGIDGRLPSIWEIGNHLAKKYNGVVEPQQVLVGKAYPIYPQQVAEGEEIVPQTSVAWKFLGAVGKDKEGTVVVIDPRGIAAYRDDMCGYDVLGTAAAQDLIDGSGANGKVTYKPQESQARLMLDC